MCAKGCTSPWRIKWDRRPPFQGVRINKGSENGLVGEEREWSWGNRSWRRKGKAQDTVHLRARDQESCNEGLPCLPANWEGALGWGHYIDCLLLQNRGDFDRIRKPEPGTSQKRAGTGSFVWTRLPEKELWALTEEPELSMNHGVMSIILFWELIEDCLDDFMIRDSADYVNFIWY